MSGSGNIINYNIRTAKSIERRMILNVIKELFKYQDISSCRYIGMGSTYFTDFKMFHKELHINKMISFEIEESLKARVDFNKPFKCIDVRIGKSTRLLQDIWEDHLIDFLWMDYDGKLDYDFFNDIEIIFSNIQAGGIYLMSCNRVLKEYTVEDFERKFGDLSPLGLSIDDFSGDKNFDTIQRMLINKIKDVITQRNYSLPLVERLIFRQLFFFTYRDGAPMLSFGGLVDKLNNDFTLQKYNLQHFDFITLLNNPYIIDPPQLSYKEVLLLNEYLPDTEDAIASVPQVSFIPKGDLNKYRKFYKYLPHYMDVTF